MSYTLQKLSNVHALVARELALGIPLEKICESKGLSLNSWRSIVTAPLFRSKVTELQQEIENQMIDDHVCDPTLATLRSETLSSAKTLVEERDNWATETGASSNSRIKAALAILDMTGYNKSSTEDKAPSIVINLSPAKLQAVKDSQDTSREKETFEGNYTEEDLLHATG